MNKPHVYRLVIFTVGGSPEPIVASILQLRPERIIFVPSLETKSQIEDVILPLLEKEGLLLSPARYETRVIADAQHFEACVKTMRDLKPEVDDWAARGCEYTVAVDITGGTKCMSAALALVAHQWVSEFIYVGGKERSKEGVGIVVSGKEQILHSLNPWNSLGYQAAEDAILFFDQGNYLAAISSVGLALPKIDNLLAKRELSALKQLTEAYERWDCFDHTRAVSKFEEVLKNLNDLIHLTQMDRVHLEQTISKHQGVVQSLSEHLPCTEMVQDLLANAGRRARQGRYDDAVARLYRAIEVMAQVRLLEKYNINSSNVAVESLPEQIRDKWENRKQCGKLQLALQADYELLSDLADDLSKSFEVLGLSGKQSPLGSRNSSILAHGFTPIGEKGFEALWQKTLKLCGVEERLLTEFPRLA